MSSGEPEHQSPRMAGISWNVIRLLEVNLFPIKIELALCKYKDLLLGVIIFLFPSFGVAVVGSESSAESKPKPVWSSSFQNWLLLPTTCFGQILQIYETPFILWNSVHFMKRVSFL